MQRCHVKKRILHFLKASHEIGKSVNGKGLCHGHKGRKKNKEPAIHRHGDCFCSLWREFKFCVVVGFHPARAQNF